jgi:hypothetical protein
MGIEKEGEVDNNSALEESWAARSSGMGIIILCTFS